MPIPDTNAIVEFFIYDCAGQSIFNQLDLNNKYYDNAAAIMVTYSIANRESLAACNKWYSAVKGAQRQNQTQGQLIGVLVGNKNDLREVGVNAADSRAEVTMVEAQSIAANLGVPYFETSAANNVGVEEPFKYIAEQFYRRYEETAAQADSMVNQSKYN